jgi:hypothetical protein
MSKRSITSLLFQAARLSADGRAIRKGPDAVAKRYVRKIAYRKVNGVLAGILRTILK